MARLKNEAAFQRMLRKSLSYCYLKKCNFIKTHGTQFTGSGVADIVGHILGYYVAIECKMNGGRPSTDQLSFLRQTVQTGAIGYFAIYNYEEGEHYVYWVPGDEVFSYRNRRKWMKTSTMLVQADPKDPSFGTTLVFDCSPMAVEIMKRSTQ